MLASALDENAAVVAAGKPWLQTYAVVDEANVVDRPRLERALERIRSRVEDPRHGVFGPGSMIWRVYGEQVTSVGGVRAVLLQPAHPFIAHSVQPKSAYRTDPQGRQMRTFRAVVDWIFGDLDPSSCVAATRPLRPPRLVASGPNR